MSKIDKFILVNLCKIDKFILYVSYKIDDSLLIQLYAKMNSEGILSKSSLCAPHISAFTNGGAWYIFKS